VKGLRELVEVLHISVRSPMLTTLLVSEVGEAAAATATAPLPGLILDDSSEPVAERGAVRNSESTLGTGIQDISQALVDDAMKPADVLVAIAEVIYRALGAYRVVICLREGSNEMRGRYGVGEGISAALRQLRFTLGGRDLFNLVLSRDVDVLISDTSTEKIRSHLPDWYQQRFDAQSFIALPLRAQGVAVGMIYADSLKPHGIHPSPEALTQLRTLRNQALMAIRLGA